MTTPDPETKPPLWRVLNAAGWPHFPQGRDQDTVRLIWMSRAAELRALADWLVPEESSETFIQGEDSHNRSKRQQRRHLRDTLLDEADRAEAGG